MEENKKKRKPNFFDVLLVVLVILVAVVAYVISHSNVGKEVVTRTYVVEIADLKEGMEDAVKPGDKVVDKIKNYDMGVVTAVEAVPHTYSVVDEETGVMKQAVVPGSICLLITVEAETIESDDRIATTGGYIIRTGTAVSCSAGKLTGSGYILEVERLEDGQ